MSNVNTSMHNIKRVEITETKQLNTHTVVRDLFIVDIDNNVYTLTLFSKNGDDSLDIHHNKGCILDVIL